MDFVLTRSDDLARTHTQARKLSYIPRFFSLHIVLVTNLKSMCEEGSQIYLTFSPSRTPLFSGKPAFHKSQAALTVLQISQVIVMGCDSSLVHALLICTSTTSSMHPGDLQLIAHTVELASAGTANAM